MRAKIRGGEFTWRTYRKSTNNAPCEGSGLSASQIQILYVITDLELGGVPLHLHRLITAMQQRDFTVAVVSLAMAGPVAKRLRDQGVDVYDCGGRGGWDIRILGRLTKLFKQIKPDIVHAMLFHANLASRWSAKRAGISAQRVLCEIQTVELERRWHLLVDRFTYRGCRFMIGNSLSVLGHLAFKAKIPRDRLRMVRGGIDPSAIVSAVPTDPVSLGLNPEVPIVLWAGRLDPAKGVANLIEAIAEVVKIHPVQLVLAGDGKLKSVLCQLIEKLELSSIVHMLGMRQDVPSLLKMADIFAFPSLTEGLPNALLEAMAAGCPIVTTDVPGCCDLIQRGETGLIVPYGDIDALAAAIIIFIRDKDRAHKLGDRAAKIVQQDWHIERTYETYAAIYRSILD